jgi:hypothetical protein
VDFIELAAWVAGAGGAIGAAAAFPLSARAFGNARLVASMPPTPIERLDPGLHEIKGALVAEGSHLAPISDRPCAYVRLLLEQRRRNRWETVLDLRLVDPAVLEEGGARCAIDLSQADVVVAAPQRIRTGLFPVPGDELDALLKKLEGTTLEAEPAGPFLRWREEVLLPGDTLYAVGTARRAEDGAWSLQSEDGPFVVSDRDEAEVVRHQRQAGRRWAAIGLASIVALAWALTRLGPALLAGL